MKKHSSTINYDPYRYNGGIAPEAGLVWSGESWGWPTTGISIGGAEETLVVWPTGDTSLSEETKDLLDNDICLVCGKKNCPYIKTEKSYQLLRDAIRAGDMKTAKKIHMTKFAQFSGMNRANFADALKKKREAQEKRDKEFLLSASAIVADSAKEIAQHLGKRYQDFANEIASDIKNFQGKRIRTLDDAMKSLEKVLANPNMKVKPTDKEALLNAWRNINANDMASKLSNVGKFFKVADAAMKVEKIREKSLVGYATGDWKPLLLEVESMAISGLASSVALGILATTLSLFSLSGLVLTALTFAGIIAISLLSSLIDDKLVDKLNRELIPSAY